MTTMIIDEGWFGIPTSTLEIMAPWIVLAFCFIYWMATQWKPLYGLTLFYPLGIFMALVIMTLFVGSFFTIISPGRQFDMSPSQVENMVQDKYGITAATGTPDDHGSSINPNDPMHNSWHASSLTIDGKTYENCDLTVSNPQKVDSKILVDAELKCSKVSDGERITIQPK